MKTIDNERLNLTPSLAQALGDGETFAVTEHGGVIAFLVSALPSTSKRSAGQAKGAFTVPSDFNEPLSEVEQSYYED